MKPKIFTYVLSLILLGLLGCSITDSDDGGDKRTYPKALNYRPVSFQNFQGDIAPPDSVNLNVYVTDISECSPKNACILADGIVISDSLHPVSPQSQYRFTVRNPSQFQKDKLYKLSVGIGTSPGNGEKHIRLVGYSLLQRID